MLRQTRSTLSDDRTDENGGDLKTGAHMKKPRKNDGFTLIEILIAMAVFPIGILAVLSMQISSVNTNTTAKKGNRQLHLGRSAG